MTNEILSELDKTRIDMIEALRDLIAHFEHSRHNANALLKSLNMIDAGYRYIDPTSEIDYLIRDHSVYSGTIRNITTLREYQTLLKKYQEID